MSSNGRTAERSEAMRLNVLHKTSKGMREMNYQYTQKFERATMPKLPIQPLLVLCGVRRCSFIVIIRVFDKYFETKIFAKNIDEAESIIENTIVNKEYQIMNIYKAK